MTTPSPNDTDLVARVCRAYVWQRALGNDCEQTPLYTAVTNRAHPDVWDTNHVSAIRAGTAAEIETVLQAADSSLRHCSHRLFVIDPLTPPAFVARLALDDYRELTPTIHMVLDGKLRATPGRFDLRPVATEEDWQCLQALLREDHLEGARTSGSQSEQVTQGILASYRQKAPAYQFFIARDEGVDCAYGAGVRCENGMGMVEDLFTLPEFRRRGIATAIIARAVEYARQGGAEPVLIGAHATEQPKRMYAKLGFVPVCLTRDYMRRSGR